MLISIILVSHLILAIAVSAGFIIRYVLLFKNKEYPLTGRKSVFVGSVLLVISGVLLSLIGKLPITSLCLDSLGLVVALLVLEFGLQKIPSRLATEKEKSIKH